MRALIFGSQVQPRDVLVGIDQLSFQVKAGHPFCGIKNIPDGLHVIHFSSSTSEESESVRYGFWFEETTGKYLQFDEAGGSYNMLHEPDEGKYEAMVQTHSHLMISYPKIEESNWPGLTNSISWEQIGIILGNPTLYVDSSMTTEEEFRVLGEKLKTRYSNHPDLHFHYTRIQFKSKDAIRQTHRMEDYTDKSYYLNHVIVPREYHGHINRLLGELQFAYCNALLFGNYGSSLQWHSIIELITFSSQVSPKFIKKFDSILALQLETFPDEYQDTLLNKQLWSRCLTASHTGKSLVQTSRVYDSKFNANSTDEDSDYAIEANLPNIDDEEQDEDNPTVVGGVYYVRR